MTKTTILEPSDNLLPTEYCMTTPAELFKPGTMEKIVAEIKIKAMSSEPDLKTIKGRKAIASMASKVSKSKTFLDGMGKDLVSGWKNQAKEVDGERKFMRDSLDALKLEVRKPLTDWENAEVERRERITGIIERIRLAGVFEVVFQEIPASEIESRLKEIERIEVNESFDEFQEMAQSTKDNSINSIKQVLALREQYDKDQSELSKLRAEREEREKKEAAEKAEQEKKAREEKIRLEAKEQAEKAAKEKAKREKEKAATKIADAKAATEKAKREKVEAGERAEREKKEAVAAAEKKAADDAEQKEKDRLAKIESKRVEDEERAANYEHREKIKYEARSSIIGILGISLAQADGIFDAIDSGKVPHISIKY